EEIEEGVDYGVKAVFKRYPREVFSAMGLRFVENIHYYLVVTFSITYLSTQAHIESGEILGLLLGAHAIHAVLVPLVGAATDRIGRRMPYGVGIVLTATWGFFAFPMYDTAQAGPIFIALLLGLSSTRSCTPDSRRSWPR